MFAGRKLTRVAKRGSFDVPHSASTSMQEKVHTDATIAAIFSPISKVHHVGDER